MQSSKGNAINYFERLKSPPKINTNNNAKNEIYAIQEE
jgi:hypothetical protein